MKTLYRLAPSTKILDDFYVLDVETAYRKNPLADSENFKGKLHWQLKATPDSFVFGVIYGLNFTKVLYSVDAIKKELLLPRYKGRKVFAHNGGAYDYPCIYGNIYLTDPQAIFNGKFISFTNGNCTFADSLNVFVGTSVKDIGRMIGNDKTGMSRDYTYSVWPKDKARDVNGCIRDCEIVWDALFGVFEFCGDIKITQAALSMTYYRRYHQPFDISYNENVKYFWESYYGGRTEAFKIGNTHASLIDVNSMYPSQMKSITFPNPKFLKYEKNVTPERLANYLEWFEGLVACSVSHPVNRFGLLPVKHNDKLVFPVGRFTGVWNFNELRFAISRGLIVTSVSYVVYSEKMTSPFISFVDHLQNMKFNAKLSGNLSEEDRSKRLSNSLYGKFAQRILTESIYTPDYEKDFDLIRDYQQKGIFVKLDLFNADRRDGFIVIGCDAKVPSYSIPSFASYITSGARVELLKKMLEYQDRNIVYCDTDSIAFEIAEGVQSSNALGGWKLEDKIITKIYGLKNYRFTTSKKAEEQRRLKGVPTDRGRTVTIFEGGKGNTFPAVSQTSSNEYRYFNLIKTKEAIRRGLTPGVLTERIKKIKNTYDKRIVLPTGETKPIEI